ncbi:MAG: hypothetical protein U0T81_04595 [Saprospiraceae bacterium]
MSLLSCSSVCFFVNEPWSILIPSHQIISDPLQSKVSANMPGKNHGFVRKIGFFETFANGGQALWDRKDYLGNEVSSGIYLVFANTVKDYDKSDGAVTKLIITR